STLRRAQGPALFTQGAQSVATRQRTDFEARQGQLDADQATDGPGTHHTDFHPQSLPFEVRKNPPARLLLSLGRGSVMTRGFPPDYNRSFRVYPRDDAETFDAIVAGFRGRPGCCAA